MSSSVQNYLSLVKFSHTLFALPFALIGFFMATSYYHYDYSWSLFVYVLLCMVFARSAAMAFNRYIDRDIDAANPRTVVREIPAGTIEPQSALWFVVANCVLFVGVTWFINPLCFWLSPVALAVILGYSYTKRYTSWCHFVLGLGLSLAPLGAFLAVTGEFSEWMPLFYSAAVLLWVSGFDIIYALQDEDFDKLNNLHSIPSKIGTSDALKLSTRLHIGTALLIVTAGVYASFGILYWIGTAIFLGLLYYQHTLVKPNDLSKVNLAFFTTNGIASVTFAFFVLLEFFVNA